MYRAPRVSRLRQQRRNQTLLRISLFVLLLLSILGGVLYVSYRPTLSIQAIEVKGDAVLSSSVAAAAEKPLGEKLFYVFPRKNIFLYPVKEMEALLLDTFPALSSVEIKREGKVLTVVTEERTPFGLFCPISAEEVASEGCFVFDKEGYIFATESSITISTSTGNLPHFGKRLTTLSPLKSSFLPEPQFTRLKELLEILFTAQFVPIHILVEEVGDYRISFKGGGTVLFSADSLPSAAVQTLALLLKSEEFTKKGYSLSSMEYIDVRFGGKIYYKPK